MEWGHKAAIIKHYLNTPVRWIFLRFSIHRPGFFFDNFKTGSGLLNRIIFYHKTLINSSIL